MQGLPCIQMSQAGKILESDKLEEMIPHPAASASSSRLAAEFS